MLAIAPTVATAPAARIDLNSDAMGSTVARMVVGIIGLVVSAVAAFFAWRAIVKADGANKIAAKALAISEREEAERIREREACARLMLSVAIVDQEPDEGGVIRLGGTGGQLRLSI